MRSEEEKQTFEIDGKTWYHPAKQAREEREAWEKAEEIEREIEERERTRAT